MRIVLLILLCSFQISSGQLSSDGRPPGPDGIFLPREEAAALTSTPTTTAEAVDLCECSNDVFEKDVMEGYFKSLDGCKQPYNCSFTVAPKVDHAVTIEFQEDVNYYSIQLFYYNGSMENLIFVKYITSSKTMYIPENYGVHLILKGSGWAEKLNAKFSRVLSSGMKFSCPSPILTANSTVQTIETEKFPGPGCAFRLSSPFPIRMNAECQSGSLLYIRMNFVNQTTNYKAEFVYSWRPKDFKLKNSTLDFYLGSAFYHDFSCKFTFYSLPYDPCNCSTTNYSLAINTPMTLMSPGYPSMLCDNIRCHYKLTAAKPAPKDSLVAFVVIAHHRSRAYGDSLEFTMDKTETVSLSDPSSNMTKDAVYVTDLLEVNYVASSILSNDHGFSVKITAVHIPKECLCPHRHLDKPIEDNSFSLVIHSHCPVMNCRFTIPNNPTLPFKGKKKIFRLQLDHYLPQKGEYLNINAGLVHCAHFDDAGYASTRRSLIDYVSNSSITVQYVRLRNESAPRESHFNMTWKWMTQADCKCDHIQEFAERNFKNLYSPMFPDEYCSNMNCTYHIEAHEGHHLELNVTFFETEPFRDFLVFYDGSPNATLTEVKRLSGFVRNSPLIRMGANATLVFTSDSSVTKRGFGVSFREVLSPQDSKKPDKGGSSVWTIIVAIVIIAALLGSVVFYCKRNTKTRVQSVDNPLISGFSNVHSVLITPIDE